MKRFLLLAGLSAVASCPAFAANLIVNGGFETGDFSGWTQGGNYDTGTSYTSVTPNDPSNGYYVYSGSYADSTGPNQTPGTLSQGFTDVAGQTYQLTFELHGDVNDGFTSNFFDTTIGSGANAQTLDLTNVLGGYQMYSLLFTGSGQDTLNFTVEDNDNYLNLDAVAVSATSSAAATPEPSSLVLLGTGVLATAGALRRRFVQR